MGRQKRAESGGFAHEHWFDYGKIRFFKPVIDICVQNAGIGRMKARYRRFFYEDDDSVFG